MAPDQPEAREGGAQVPKCPATYEACRCRHEAGHEDSPHECECGGAWDDAGYVCRWPQVCVAGPLAGEPNPGAEFWEALLPTPQPGAAWALDEEGAWVPA